MRGRLIELVTNAIAKHTLDIMVANIKYITDVPKEAECIADYLLSKGVIVPPCKVGQTVYVVSQGQGFNMRWDIYEGKVTDIHINRHNELEIRVENGEKFFGYYKPCFVFLTREEAEQALKGIKE